MRIVVCIKQVPDTIEINIDPQTRRIRREEVKGIINPLDTYAIEEAIRLKERFGGEAVALSMGPPQAEGALREAISMGVDRAVLLSDRKFVGSDTLATSYAIACAVRKIGEFDILLCGLETLDGSTGQVGPEMAENLGIPCVPYVSRIEAVQDGRICCVRLLEDHYETLESPLPAVLTVVKEINTPRIPSLKGLLKAKKAEIPVWNAADVQAADDRIGHDGSPTWVVDCWRPVHKKEGRIVRGEPDELADALHEELKRLGVV